MLGRISPLITVGEEERAYPPACAGVRNLLGTVMLWCLAGPLKASLHLHQVVRWGLRLTMYALPGQPHRLSTQHLPNLAARWAPPARAQGQQGAGCSPSLGWQTPQGQCPAGAALAGGSCRGQGER